MPFFEVELDDGRVFEVEADRPPTNADMMAYLGQQQATPQAQAPAEKDLPMFSFGDTLSGIGTALSGLPVTSKAAYYRMLEGMTRPDLVSPSARAAFEEERKYVEGLQAEQAARQAAGTATDVGEAFRSVGPSLGFSVGTLGAALPMGLAGEAAGAPIGGGIGAAIAGPPGAAVGAGIGKAAGGLIGAGVAAGAAAYRMAGSQFLQDAFDTLEAQSMAENGRPMTEAERQSAYEEILPWAENSALWEAGPEAVSNAALAIGGPVVLKLGKAALDRLAANAATKAAVNVATKAPSIGADIGKRAAVSAGLLGTELGTETLTELGQAPERAKVEALAQGLPPEQAVSPYAPGMAGFGEALKEVAPGTLAISALTAGLGATAKGGLEATRALRRMVAPPVVETTPEGVPTTFEETIQARVQPTPPAPPVPVVTPQVQAAVNAATAASQVADSVQETIPATADALRTVAANNVIAAAAPQAVPAAVEAEQEAAPVVAEEVAPMAEPVAPIQPAPIEEVFAEPALPTNAPQPILPEQPVPTPQAEAEVAPVSPETPPLETTPDATLQGQVPSNRIQERVQTDEGRNAAEASRGSRPLVSGQVQAAAQEEITIPQQGVVPTESLLQGHVTLGGAAVPSVRDTTKPEQMTPEELDELEAQAISWANTPDDQIVARYQKEFKASDAFLAAYPFAPENWRETQRRMVSGPPARGSHKKVVQKALSDRKKVSAEAVDTYNITLPEGYVREGDLYVYRPSVAAPTLETPTAQEAVAPAPSPAIPQVGDAVVYREQGQDIEGTFTSLDNFGRAVIQRPDGSVARTRVQSLRPLPSARGQSGRQESGQVASNAAPLETGSSASVAVPIVSETTEKSTADSALELLRQRNDAELPAAALQRWTPSVYDKARNYYQTGDTANLSGLSAIQRGRIERALQDATPGAAQAIEQREAVEEKRMAKREKKEREFVARSTFNVERSGNSDVYTSDRGQGSINIGGGLGISKNAAQQVVDEFRMDAENAPAILVVSRADITSSRSSMFASIQEGVAAGKIDPNTVEGWYNFPHGPAFIVHDNLASMDRARQVIIHEVLSHYGIDSFTTEAERQRFADAVRRVAPDLIADVADRYPNLDGDMLNREMIAAFVSALESADPANTPSSWRALWERIKRWIRGAIRRLGGDPNAFDDYDLYTMVVATQRRVTEGLTAQEQQQLRELQDSVSMYSMAEAERTMTPQTRLMRSYEDEIQNGWRLVQAAEEQRTIEGETVPPVAYRIKGIPMMTQGANAWLDAFKGEYADMTASDRGKLLMRTLATRQSPTGAALAPDVIAAITMPLVNDNRVYEFDLTRSQIVQMGLQSASASGRALRLQREIYDPIAELQNSATEKAEGGMKRVGADYQQFQQGSVDAQKQEVRDIARDTGNDPQTPASVSAAASPSQDAAELNRFLNWMRNLPTDGIEQLETFIQKFVQVSRFDTEAFTAAIQKNFPLLEMAVVDAATAAVVKKMNSTLKGDPALEEKLKNTPTTNAGAQALLDGRHLPDKPTLREQLEQDGANRIADAFFRGTPKGKKPMGPLSEGSAFVNNELTGLLNDALDRLGVKRPDTTKPKDEEMRRLIVELGLNDLRQGKMDQIDAIVRGRIAEIADTGAVEHAKELVSRWEQVSATMRSETASGATLRRALNVVMEELKVRINALGAMSPADAKPQITRVVKTVMDRVRRAGTPEAGGVDATVLNQLEADLRGEMTRLVQESRDKRKQRMEERELLKKSPKEAERRGQLIIDILAQQLSDTPPMQRGKPAPDALMQLVRDAIAADTDMVRFQELAMDFGMSEQTAATMARMVMEARSRRIGVEFAKQRNRLEEVRKRAIERLIDGLMFDPKNRENKEPLGRFMSSLLRASEYGILDNQTFVEAFGASFGINRITPQILADLTKIWNKLSAVDDNGFEVIYGMERQQADQAFKEMVNSVAPAARWDNVLYNNFIARVLASVSSMFNQMSGLFKTLTGMSAFQRSILRGDVTGFTREWWQNTKDMWDALPAAIAAVQGTQLGLFPASVTGRTAPTEQSLMLTPKGQTFRVQIGNKVVALPDNVRKVLRAMELFTWRLIAGVEGISGIVDSKGIMRDTFVRYFREQKGMSPKEAWAAANRALAYNAEDKAQARAQAEQEFKDGKLGPSKAAINLRAQQILQRNAEVKLGVNLNPSIQQLTAASQFKTVPTGLFGSAIYHFFNNIGGSDAAAARVARFWLIFGRFMGHTFDTMFAWSPLGFLTTSPAPDSQRGRAIRQIYADIETYRKQQHAKAASSVAFLTLTATMQALALLLADDEDEPFFQVFGTGPMASPDDKKKMEASGLWREGVVRIFGQDFAYTQIPELAALFSVLGNISDYTRFGSSLYRDKEGQPKELEDAAFFGAVDTILSPLKRSTYRQYFTFLTKLMEGKPGDAGWNVLTGPLGGMLRFPLVVDADKMFREAEGAKDAKGFVDNSLRRIPFVHVGEAMYNAYGEPIPGFGVISMFPPEGKSSDAVKAAARLNVYTGTTRSQPSDVQMLDGEEVPVETRNEYVRRAGRYYTELINQNADSIRRAYDEVGFPAAQDAVSRISAAANERARAELGLRSKR